MRHQFVPKNHGQFAFQWHGPNIRVMGPQFHRVFFRTEHIVRRMGLPMVKGGMVGECLRVSQQKICLSQGRKKQLGLGNGCHSVHSLMLPSVQSTLFA
jgi:hypothetical protein